VVVTRFTPFIRGPVYLAAGISGLEVRRFLVLDASAALVQVPLLLWIGSRLGMDATVAEAWQRIGWLSGGLVLAALTVAVVLRVTGTSRPTADAALAPPPC
jgi:membrane protein DedA with SNARE-associated domain